MKTIAISRQTEILLQERLARGRFHDANHVVSDALVQAEMQQRKLDRLRAHLAEGVAEADAGCFVDDFSIEQLLRE